ncbi:MAG: SDR family NAD(P)-dependent oxidoreductase [Rhodobacterales bacterium]
MSEWKQVYKGKTVLITGCCGTVGAMLIKQLMALEPKAIKGIDNVEEQLYYQQLEYRDESRFSCKFADIKSPQQLTRCFEGVDIVIHTAALKQVPICEEVPDAAVDTNITGVQNVIHAANANRVVRVLFTSSDKAVNPTNVMGTSKLMGERLITAANVSSANSTTIFASTRFGNIAGSRGSVMPIFHQQIKQGANITLTSEHMTRFMMTNENACRLVLQSCAIAQGGEVFVTKMAVISIKQLAEVMRRRLAPVYGRKPEDIKIEIVGPRPGEKDYEELTTQEEIRRTKEGENLLVILPAYSAVYGTFDYDYPFDLRPAKQEYNSNTSTLISDQALAALFDDIDLPR